MQCAKSIVKGPTEHRHCPICRAGIERVVNVGNRAIIRWQSEDFIRCEDGVGECLLFVVMPCTRLLLFLPVTQILQILLLLKNLPI